MWGGRCAGHGPPRKTSSTMHLPSISPFAMTALRHQRVTVNHSTSFPTVLCSPHCRVGRRSDPSCEVEMPVFDIQFAAPLAAQSGHASCVSDDSHPAIVEARPSSVHDGSLIFAHREHRANHTIFGLSSRSSRAYIRSVVIFTRSPAGGSWHQWSRIQRAENDLPRSSPVRVSSPAMSSPPPAHPPTAHVHGSHQGGPRCSR